MIKKISFLLLLGSLSTSCVAVKEYEKVYINDPDMLLLVFKFIEKLRLGQMEENQAEVVVVINKE